MAGPADDKPTDESSKPLPEEVEATLPGEVGNGDLVASGEAKSEEAAKVTVEGPKQRISGGTGTARFKGAVGRVKEANTLQLAMEGLGVKQDGDKKDLALELAKIKAEDELQRDEQAKNKVTKLLLFVLFLDSLGPFLMAGNAPSLFNPPIDGATQSQMDGGMGIWYLNGDVERFPFMEGEIPDEPRPTQVALAMQSSQTTVLIAQGVAGLISAQISRAFGRKGALLLFTVGGGFMFVLAGYSGEFARGRVGGMYIYLGCRALMGLFAGCQPVVQSFIADIWETSEPAVKAKKNMMIVMPILAAVALGPIMATFLAPLGDNLFLPLYVGGAFEFLGGVLVLTQIPAVRSTSKKDAALRASKAAGEEKKPTGFFRWILVFWLARFFDRSGAGQLQYLQVVQKVPPVAWPALQDVHVFNYLLVGIAVVFVVTMATMGKWSAKFGIGYASFFGQSIAGVTFFLLGTVGLLHFAAYVPIMYVLFYFSGIATLFAIPMFSALAPAAERDRWIGYQTMFQNLSTAFCPFVLLPVMKLETAGNLWTGAFLHFNGIFCLLSGLCYLLLSRKKFPMPPKVKPVSEETKQAIKDFEETGSIKWLPFTEMQRINKERVLAGQPRVTEPFGTFEEDRHDLERITALAKEDFPHTSKYLRGNIKKWTKGTEKDRDELRTLLNGIEQLLDWPEEDAEAFSKWIVEYMKYAGYLNPTMNPRFWKSCVMQAFPKIGAGDTREELIANFKANPVPVWTQFDTMCASYMRTLKENEATVKALSSCKVNSLQIVGAA
jgi:MFS family permease